MGFGPSWLVANTTQHATRYNHNAQSPGIYSEFVKSVKLSLPDSDLSLQTYSSLVISK
jgi:hypothetical protein